MPGICLNMIVKDEARILERCLASVAPWINHYVIADTGSRDGTPDLVTRFFKERDVPGEVVHLPFENFEQARNGALEAARASKDEFDYILLTDADMELVVEDDAFRDQLKEPAHLVRQVAGIEYDNIRFVSRHLDARYVGVTHEFLDTRGCSGEPRIDGAWFNDHAEGSSRSVKSKRDAKLLRDGLKKDPGNARYMFYLAQTYKDLERWDEAIRWYERRIAAGGYAEEVWYSQYQIAHCERARGRREHFVTAALKAYQMRPQRSEPLLMLATDHRERGENEVAVMFAEMGAGIPVPADHLFLETYAYRHGFRHEIAIAGFYSVHPSVRAQAYEDCMDLTTTASAPRFVRDTAIRNAIHYLRSATEAFGDRIRLHKLAIEATSPELVAMNPSVAVRREDGALVANVRWVNYRIGAWPPVIRTENEHVTLALDDAGVRVLSRRLLVDATGVERVPHARIRGFEDLRIFEWRGGWWATSTTRDLSVDEHAEIVLLRLELPPDPRTSGRIVSAHPQRGVSSGRHEKNWVPLVRDDELLLVYEADPTTVLRIDPETLSAVETARSTPDLALDHLRGSSQAVPFIVDDGRTGFLYLAHEALEEGGGRIYSHRLVWLDENLEVGHVSDPFYFTRRGVEFCAGLASYGDDLVLSFGVHDAEAWLAIVPRDAAREWLLAPARRRGTP